MMTNAIWRAAMLFRQFFSEAIFINCKNNDEPISQEWLRKKGALN